MMSDSILGSYDHVVYENKKKFEKKVFRKIFFEWWKFFGRKFLTLFFESPPNSKMLIFKKDAKNFRPIFFRHSKKYFSRHFFFKTFLFS